MSDFETRLKNEKREWSQLCEGLMAALSEATGDQFKNQSDDLTAGYYRMGYDAGNCNKVCLVIRSGGGANYNRLEIGCYVDTPGQGTRDFDGKAVERMKRDGASITTSISCATARGTAAIVKDISRRLLASIPQRLEAIRALIAEKDNQNQQMEQLLQRVLKAIPGSKVREDRRETQSAVVWLPGSIYSCQVTNYSDGPQLSFEVRGVPFHAGLELMTKLSAFSK